MRVTGDAAAPMSQAEKTSAVFPDRYHFFMVWTAIEVCGVFGRSLFIRMQEPGWNAMMTTGIIQSGWLDLHALTAMLWLLLCLTQFYMGRFAARRAGRARTIHRGIGRAMTLVLVPVMAVAAAKMLSWNPRGIGMGTVYNIYAMLVLALGMFFVGVWRARRGELAAHRDAMYVAFVALAGVATYRLMLVLLAVTVGGEWLGWGPTVTWLVVLLKLLWPALEHGRVRHNLAVLAYVILGLLGSVALVFLG